ncbi:MAG: radical SAM/SPASM domain-containing protein [Candidatus Margulisiibacteriota bacterium]
MFDIHFYMQSHDLVNRMLNGETFDHDFIVGQFEGMRRKEPVVYNIETTNACNMKCKMCPRTTRMTRKVETIDKDTFIHIIDQLRPWSKDEWSTWEKFVKEQYNIEKEEQSENNFFLYIIPKVIQLHGYGDPLLDKNMSEYVKLLTERGFHSYFSCNPANIDLATTVRMFENGLSYIKYSIESVDDARHKEIRGDQSNFTQSYNKILELINLKKQRGLTTRIVITMLDLNNSWQEEEYQKLKAAFKDLDVYLYLKSEDQQWYRQNYHGTKSVHWSEICKHPWMSMTVKSNAEVVMCMEDYNNEIILGNAKEESLYAIWNGDKYKAFREAHFNLSKGLKCSDECDMHLVGEYLKGHPPIAKH